MAKLGCCGYFGNDGRGRNNGGVSGDGETVALLTPPFAFAHTVAAHNTVVRSRTHRCPTNTVILREVAVSMVACRGRWLLWLKHWHWQGEMDSATARGMTKLECCGLTGACRATGKPLPYQHRHSPLHTPLPHTTPSSVPAHTVALPTPSYCAKSQYPWWRAEVGAGGDGFRDCARNDEACVLRVLRKRWGRGRWIPRLGGMTMDSATARGMAKFGFCAYSKNEALSFAWAEGGLTSLVNSLIQLLSGIN